MLGSCWRRKTHVHMDCSTSQGSHHLCHSKMQSLSDLPLSLPINHSSPLPLSLFPLLFLPFLLFLSSYQSFLSPSLLSLSIPPSPPYRLPPLSLFLSIVPLFFSFSLSFPLSFLPLLLSPSLLRALKEYHPDEVQKVVDNISSSLNSIYDAHRVTVVAFYSEVCVCVCEG